MPTLDSGTERAEDEPLRFVANLDCVDCGTTFEGLWLDWSIDLQQIREAPVANQTCPHCGHKQEEEYPGWSFWSEAG